MSASDLVLDSKIETSFVSILTSPTEVENVTRHVRMTLGSSSRARQLRTEELWKREKCLGAGFNGVVWLERRVETASSSGQPTVDKDRSRGEELRAVKEIKKKQWGSAGNENNRHTAATFHRELEAMAKFSQEKVCRCFPSPWVVWCQQARQQARRANRTRPDPEE